MADLAKGLPTPTGFAWNRYAAWSALELYATVDGLTSERLAAVEARSDACHLMLIDQQLDGAARELERRVRRHRAGNGPRAVSPYARDLSGIAARVRREMDIQVPLTRAGWRPSRVAARGELAGPCPFCPGGHDRFVVWPAGAAPGGRVRDGRVWCRRCGYSADVIGLARDLERTSFPEALGSLAESLGVALPEPDPATIRLALDGAYRTRERPPAPAQGAAPALPPGRPGPQPTTGRLTDTTNQEAL